MQLKTVLLHREIYRLDSKSNKYHFWYDEFFHWDDKSLELFELDWIDFKMDNLMQVEIGCFDAFYIYVYVKIVRN